MNVDRPQSSQMGLETYDPYDRRWTLDPLWEMARPAAEQVARQLLCRLPGNEADIQDVLARVHYALVHFKCPESDHDRMPHLIAFARRVARDACVDLLRGFSRKRCVAFSLMPIGWEETLGGTDPTEQILDSVNAGSDIRQVARLLSEIPFRQSIAWLLHLDSDIAQEVYQSMRIRHVSKRCERLLCELSAMLERTPVPDYETARWLQASPQSVRQLRWRARAYLAEHFQKNLK
jgi:DNA-directed RNA polymerase specialized sigma24 family protein